MSDFLNCLCLEIACLPTKPLNPHSSPVTTWGHRGSTPEGASHSQVHSERAGEPGLEPQTMVSQTTALGCTPLLRPQPTLHHPHAQPLLCRGAEPRAKKLQICSEEPRLRLQGRGEGGEHAARATRACEQGSAVQQSGWPLVPRHTQATDGPPPGLTSGTCHLPEAEFSSRQPTGLDAGGRWDKGLATHPSPGSYLGAP